MKIGIIADIHGNHYALQAVMNFFDDNVDKILFSGDLVGYYPFVRECLKIWDHKKILSVRGNHDQTLIDFVEKGTPLTSYSQKYGYGLERSLTQLSKAELSTISSWPLSLSVRLEKYVIKMIHGAPWDELAGRVYPDFSDWHRFNNINADVIIMGHTHYPFVKQWNQKLLINPGSVGQPRNHPGPHAYCAVLDVSTFKAEQHAIPYDANELIDDARAHDKLSAEWARYFITDNQ